MASSNSRRLSPPEGVYDGIKELRKTMFRLSKIVGLYGGMSVFHPYRCGTGEWHWSPHFHTLGYGRIIRTKEVYENEGWIVKNLGVRKDVARVSNYLLSHAGIRKGNHTVTWFGELGYAKLKVQAEQELDNCFPYCKSPLVFLKLIATYRPPTIFDDFEGLIDCDGWEIRIGEWVGVGTGLSYDEIRNIITRR